MKDRIDRKKNHEALLDKWYEKYQDLEIDENEFTWDGPSNWDKYSSSKPRILFLMKEAPSGFHPKEPNQKLVNSTGWNLARWKYLIHTTYSDKNALIRFLEDEKLRENNDDTALIEVKKLDEKKKASSKSEIETYARNDRDFLKQQIELIDPNVILCCRTSDAFDIIYEHTIEIEEGEKLSEEDSAKCWKIGNRLVIEFYHPCTDYRGKNLKKDKELFDLLYRLINSADVFKHFNW